VLIKASRFDAATSGCDPAIRTAPLLAECKLNVRAPTAQATGAASRRESCGVSPVHRRKACRKLAESLNPSANAMSSIVIVVSRSSAARRELGAHRTTPETRCSAGEAGA
jgi:hypothetical protein